MKVLKILILPLCLLMLVLTGCSQQPNGVSSTGKPIVLASYQGKWIVINYWATWCKPCLTEMPDLEKFYQAHKNHVMVLGVNFDGIDDAQMNQFAKKVKVTFPLLNKLTSTKPDLGEVKILPTTIIISPEGKVTKRLLGPQSAAQLAQATDLTATKIATNHDAAM